MASTKTTRLQRQKTRVALLEYLALSGKVQMTRECARAMNVDHKTATKMCQDLVAEGLIAKVLTTRLGVRTLGWKYLPLPLNGPKKKST